MSHVFLIKQPRQSCLTITGTETVKSTGALKINTLRNWRLKLRQGRWVVDAMETPILLDTDGVLYNGQNRCMAVILADQGVVVQCRVETPEECQRLYASLDLGKARSVADITGLNQSNIVQPILYLMRCAGLEGRLKGRGHRIADRGYLYGRYPAPLR